MRINTNVAAINAHKNLTQTQSALGSSMQKLSSGFRINRAADDAAGLGIANALRATTRSLVQASRNAEQANSLLQIAEGGTGTIQKMLERMKELASQAASDTVDDAGRLQLQKEFDALVDEIDRTVDTTKFQGTKLLDGNTPTFKFMVSSSGEYGGQDAVSVSLTGVQTTSLGTSGAELSTLKTAVGAGTPGSTHAAQAFAVTSGTANDSTVSGNGTYEGTSETLQIRREAGAWEVSEDGTSWTAFTSGNAVSGITITIADGATPAADGTIFNLAGLQAPVAAATTGGLLSVADAEGTLASIDAAVGQLADVLGDIGAAQNRIEYASDNVRTAIQNFTAAESVIRDVDMAEEMTKFSKNNILAQAGTAMLAQANQTAQGVLQLLRG